MKTRKDELAELLGNVSAELEELGVSEKLKHLIDEKVRYSVELSHLKK